MTSARAVLLRPPYGAPAWTLADIDVAGIYDSFTITLAMLLEEIGLSQPGRAGDDAAAASSTATDDCR